MSDRLLSSIDKDDASAIIDALGDMQPVGDLIWLEAQPPVVVAAQPVADLHFLGDVEAVTPDGAAIINLRFKGANELGAPVSFGVHVRSAKDKEMVAAFASRLGTDDPCFSPYLPAGAQDEAHGR